MLWWTEQLIATKCGHQAIYHYFPYLLVLFFCLVITLGNVIIVIVVVINPLETLRSTFSYVVVNLAVADLIVGIISMHITIYFHVLEYWENKSDALSLKKFSHIILFTSLTASLLCLILFSIDRYVAVTFLYHGSSSGS